MPETDEDSSEPANIDDPATELPMDNEWNESLGIREPAQRTGSPFEQTDDDTIASFDEGTENTTQSPTMEGSPFVESSSPTSALADITDGSRPVKSQTSTSQTQDKLDSSDISERENIMTDIHLCNMKLDKPSQLLVPTADIENNINFIFNRFASGAAHCHNKGQVKFLAQDLTRQGLVDQSNQLLFREWPNLDGEIHMDVLLLLYARILEKASQGNKNQLDNLQKQVKEFKKTFLDLEMEKTKNEEILRQKEALEQELKQKDSEAATNDTVESRYATLLDDLKKNLEKHQETNKILKNQLSQQKETVSQLRIKQASMIPLADSSAELASIRDTLEQAERDKVRLEEERERIAIEATAKKAKLEVTSNELTAALTAKKDLQRQLDAAKKDNEKQQVVITDLNITHKVKLDEIQSMTGDNEELIKDSTTKDAKIAALKKKLAEKEKLLSKEKPDKRLAQAHKTEVEGLLAKLEGLKKDKQKTVSNMTSQKEELQKVKQKLTEAEEELGAVKREKDQLMASEPVDNPEVYHLEEKLSAAEYDLEEMKKDRDELQDKSNQKKAIIKSLEDKIKALELRLEGSAAEETVKAMQKKIAELEQHLEEKTEKIHDLEDTNAKWSVDLDQSEEEIESLKDQLRSAQDRLEAKEKRIAELFSERRKGKLRKMTGEKRKEDHQQDELPKEDDSAKKLPSPSPLLEESTGSNRSASASPTISSTDSSVDSLSSKSSEKRTVTPERRVLETDSGFFEPADPKALFPLDIKEQEILPQPERKRHGPSPRLTNKFGRISQSPEPGSSPHQQALPEEALRPPLLREHLYEHYDVMTRNQHNKVLRLLRTHKGRIMSQLLNDHQFIDHLRGDSPEATKQAAVQTLLRSIAQCATLRQLRNWSPAAQSQNDFQPFPDLSEGSPEWKFIAHRKDPHRFVHHASAIALMRAYCSKIFRFFEFVRTSSEATAEDVKNTFLLLHPFKKDTTGAIRSLWEMKIDITLVLLVLRLIFYETDNITFFSHNKEKIDHYNSLPFTPEWVDEMITVRSDSDPYLLPRRKFLYLYAEGKKCANAIEEWENRGGSRYGEGKPSIMDRL